MQSGAPRISTTDVQVSYGPSGALAALLQDDIGR